MRPWSYDPTDDLVFKLYAVLWVVAIGAILFI